MWNFVGRQNDIQGHGEVNKGNWISGFNFIDKHIAGDQSLLPPDLANNKGHNVFYFLPLILGLVGLFFQAYSGKKGIESFWVTFFLFFMTGIAIVIYLNQLPRVFDGNAFAHVAKLPQRKGCRRQKRRGEHAAQKYVPKLHSELAFPFYCRHRSAANPL